MCTHSKNRHSINRRHFLTGMGATAALSFTGAPAFAINDPDARFVKIFLRGGMDGLAAVVPHGDPDHETARGSMATPRSETVDLDGFFGLDQRLSAIKSLYDARQAVLFHAINTPYEDRSHFEAMDTLDLGATGPKALGTGWIARMANTSINAGGATLSMGGASSLSTAGANKALSYSRSPLKAAPTRMLSALKGAYRRNPLLVQGLQGGRQINRLATNVLASLPAGAQDADDEVGPSAAFAQLAGTFLKSPKGPRMATLDIGGWDTHDSQTDIIRYALFPALNSAIEQLQTSMAPVWDKTTILVVSEFGRQVLVNGTNGTDHGIGGVAMLMGGAVNGGRVQADWPGLARQNLVEGDAVRSTQDLRGVMKAIAKDHFKIPTALVNNQVIPDSASAPAMRDLFI